MIGNEEKLEVSILIVSKNRKEALHKTLSILENYIDRAKHEICVFLDGCTDDSKDLKRIFSNVKWLVSNKSLGASKARSILYKTAKGSIFIGLDDDAHPLQSNFINRVQNVYNNYSNLGVIAFQEIKGVFESDSDAIMQAKQLNDYYCSTFIGCGFAIKKEIYDETNGFPEWIDIYGEEDCVAIEVLSKGYDILYVNTIFINHRVNLKARKNLGYDQFRFKRQLKNTAFYYLVYYQKPLWPIIKLFGHNFKKYALKNMKYFLAFVESFFQVVLKFKNVIGYRNIVSKSVIQKKTSLQPPQF